MVNLIKNKVQGLTNNKFKFKKIKRLKSTRFNKKKKSSSYKYIKSLIYNPFKTVTNSYRRKIFIILPDKFRALIDRTVRQFSIVTSFKIFYKWSFEVKKFKFPVHLISPKFSLISKKVCKRSLDISQVTYRIKNMYTRFNKNSYSELLSSAINYDYNRKVNNFKGFLARKRLDDELEMSTVFFKEDFLAHNKRIYKKRGGSYKKFWKK